MFKKYDAYKDSGVQWLGEIPSEWAVLRAKNLFNFRKIINAKYQCDNVLSLTLRGVVNNSFDNPEGLIPKDYATYQIFNKNDLVFKLIDLENISTSRVGLVHEKGIMSPAYIRLECNETVIPKFAYYYFYNLYLQAVFNKLGAGVRSTLSQKDLLELPYLYLCKEQQIKIVDFLETKILEIDQAIALKEQQIALLNERKQIVIQKLVTQGLNPNIPMKDSGVEWIGEIPEYWKIQKLSYLAKLDSGSTPDRSNLSFWSNGIIPWLKTGEINYNLIENSEEFVTPLALSKTALKLAPKGTLLMAMYGQGITRGRVAILNFEATYNQACCAIQCKSKLINWYLFYFFVFAYSFIRDGGNETSQMNISTGYISNLKVVLPPVEEQLQIINYLDSEMGKFEEAKINLKQQIEKLKEYKTTLINDAVTGKIKVV